MKISGLSDRGLVRSHNEDAMAFDETIGYLVVADGVGGHAAGETAAMMAVEVFKEAYRFRAAYERRPPSEEKEFLELLSAKANMAIHKMSKTPSLAEMGTTIVALSACKGFVAVMHVGDSRAYLFRNKRLKRITADHSFADARRVFGLFRRSDEEIRRDPLRNVVLRALGPEPEVKCDVALHRVKPGDVFLLCSDGLSDYVSEKTISWTMSEKGADLAAAAEALVGLANANGGHDNVTVGLAAF